MNAKRKKDVNEKKIKQLALAERAKHCEGCPARIEVNATIPEHGTAVCYDIECED
jgi:hypothetical protein